MRLIDDVGFVSARRGDIEIPRHHAARDHAYPKTRRVPPVSEDHPLRTRSYGVDHPVQIHSLLRLMKPQRKRTGEDDIALFGGGRGVFYSETRRGPSRPFASTGTTGCDGTFLREQELIGLLSLPRTTGIGVAIRTRDRFAARRVDFRYGMAPLLLRLSMNVIGKLRGVAAGHGGVPHFQEVPVDLVIPRRLDATIRSFSPTFKT